MTERRLTLYRSICEIIEWNICVIVFAKRRLHVLFCDTGRLFVTSDDCRSAENTLLLTRVRQRQLRSFSRSCEVLEIFHIGSNAGSWSFCADRRRDDLAWPVWPLVAPMPVIGSATPPALCSADEVNEFAHRRANHRRGHGVQGVQMLSLIHIWRCRRRG